MKASSFCNDDNKCNGAVGENFINCPADCPPPAKGEVGPPPALPIELATSAPQTTKEPDVPQSEITPTTPDDTSVIKSAKAVEKPLLSRTMIIVLLVSVILLLVLMSLWKIRKNMD